jgi:hypothetical protein
MHTGWSENLVNLHSPCINLLSTFIVRAYVIWLLPPGVYPFAVNKYYIIIIIPIQRPRSKWADNINMGCTEVGWEEDISGSDLVQRQVAGCCKHDDEPSGWIKWWRIQNELLTYWLLKKESVPWCKFLISEIRRCRYVSMVKITSLRVMWKLTGDWTWMVIILGYLLLRFTYQFY